MVKRAMWVLLALTLAACGSITEGDECDGEVESDAVCSGGDVFLCIDGAWEQDSYCSCELNGQITCS